MNCVKIVTEFQENGKENLKKNFKTFKSIMIRKNFKNKKKFGVY